MGPLWTILPLLLLILVGANLAWAHSDNEDDSEVAVGRQDNELSYEYVYVTDDENDDDEAVIDETESVVEKPPPRRTSNFFKANADAVKQPNTSKQTAGKKAKNQQQQPAKKAITRVQGDIGFTAPLKPVTEKLQEVERKYSHWFKYSM